MGLPQFDSIAEPIADDHWGYNIAGEQRTSRVTIGKPQQDAGSSHGDWMCPTFIEHFTDRIVPVMGVGPVDALRNAINLVRAFEEKVGPVTPRATPTD